MCSILLTESLSVLQALENLTVVAEVTNPFLVKIKNVSAEISASGKTVQFGWVHALVSLAYNKKVRQIAKKY